MVFREELKIILGSLILLLISFSGFAENTPPNFANGAKEWANNCARCHNYRSPQEYSAENWQVIMQHMRMEAGITGQTARDIYAYIASQSKSASTMTSTPAAPTNEQTTTSIAAAPTNEQTAASTSAASAHGETAASTPAAPTHGETATSPTTVSTNEKAAASTSPNNVAAKTTLVKTQAQSTPSNTSAASALSGKQVYDESCVACHGANGKGAIHGVPDFTSPSSPLKKSDSILLDHIEHGYQSPGSPMAMPARGGNPKLTNEDLKNALDYIRKTYG